LVQRCQLWHSAGCALTIRSSRRHFVARLNSSVRPLGSHMASSTNKLLVVGAALSALAALIHLACLVVGAPLFRLLGAGEQMAQLHLAGHWYPTVVTLVIAGVLAVWSAYALSGAG